MLPTARDLKIAFSWLLQFTCAPYSFTSPCGIREQILYSSLSEGKLERGKLVGLTTALISTIGLGDTTSIHLPPPPLIHSEFPSPSAITSAGLRACLVVQPKPSVFRVLIP